MVLKWSLRGVVGHTSRRILKGRPHFDILCSLNCHRLLASAKNAFSLSVSHYKGLVGKGVFEAFSRENGGEDEEIQFWRQPGAHVSLSLGLTCARDEQVRKSKK